MNYWWFNPGLISIRSEVDFIVKNSQATRVVVPALSSASFLSPVLQVSRFVVCTPRFKPNDVRGLVEMRGLTNDPSRIYKYVPRYLSIHNFCIC